MEVSASRQDGGVDAGAQAVAELRRGSAAHRGLRAALAALAVAAAAAQARAGVVERCNQSPRGSTVG